MSVDDTGSKPFLPLTGSDERRSLGSWLMSYDRYLRSIARKEIRGKHLELGGVSDVLQDTLKSAVRAATSFRGRSEAELKAWLRGILMHQMRKAFRYTAVRRRKLEGVFPVGATVSSGDPLNEIPDDGPTPSREVSQREEVKILYEALARLREHDRQLILWRNLERLSFPDIASRRGGTEDSAQKAWYRAFQRLQRQFEGLAEAS